ncbi:MAG: hypothetical protein AAB359_01415, partial [Elusimicrobiota bacterium]
MDDRDKKILKPGMPPLPPGMLKPNLPSASGGGKPSLPPIPQPPFGVLPSAQPQKDASAAQFHKDASAAQLQKDA